MRMIEAKKVYIGGETKMPREPDINDRFVQHLRNQYKTTTSSSDCMYCENHRTFQSSQELWKHAQVADQDKLPAKSEEVPKFCKVYEQSSVSKKWVIIIGWNAAASGVTIVRKTVLMNLPQANWWRYSALQEQSRRTSPRCQNETIHWNWRVFVIRLQSRFIKHWSWR